MKIKDITGYLESIAPLSLQESYDNAGLIIGKPETELKGVLITLDTTEQIIDEAIGLKCNLIISHHPIVFKGLKRFNGSNFVERTVIKALKNDIAVYAAHTNIDNVIEGVNMQICNILSLVNCKILSPGKSELRKLVVFVPTANADKVREAIFSAGAGHIGNYDCCSFNLEGTGTFRGGDATNPYVGEKGKLHFESEIRIETIYPKYIEKKLIAEIIKAHPYEEVAHDIYPLGNSAANTGAGMIGETEKPINEIEFLKLLKTKFNVKLLKHTKLRNKPIKKVALCGGAGSFLLKNAISAHADIFISGDFKYHDFFNADNKIVIADVGHYESEQFTKELFFEILTKKFNNFACFLSKVYTNPVNII